MVPSTQLNTHTLAHDSAIPGGFKCIFADALGKHVAPETQKVTKDVVTCLIGSAEPQLVA